MHHKTLLRWIAEAEAQWVRSFALLIREASEPQVCITAVAVPSRLAPLYRVAARLGRRVRSRLVHSHLVHSHRGDCPPALSPVARLTPDE